MAVRPIQRIKHVVDSGVTLAKNTNLDQNLVAATDTPVLAITTDVITGSKVNGIYLRVVVSPNETAAGIIPNVYMYVIKNPGGNLTLPSANQVGSSDNKRYIIHQEMRMLNALSGGNPIVLFDGVIVIPKGYRRFGPNDELTLRVICGQLNTAVCFQCHYKEFR